MKKQVKDTEKAKKLFLEKCYNKYGDKFDYSKINYVNSITKVELICKKHGSFFVRPDAHLRKVGCPKCNGGIKYTQQEYIEIAISKHGNKYDYSKINYINSQINIELICKKHGQFSINPMNHLIGQGCVDCAGTRRKTTEQFINEANIAHNFKYDYSKTIYKNNRTKVLIGCPNPYHGFFEQNPKDHVSGHGCNLCACYSKGNEKIAKLLISLGIEFEREYTFPDCRTTRVLPFDFFLKKYKILIEYDGIQHFIPRERFGGDAEFINRQFIDKIKTEYCLKNNILLIRIAYNDKEGLNNLKNYLMTIL